MSDKSSIRFNQAAKLRAYGHRWSGNNGGQSQFGAQLELAERESFGSKPCAQCGGSIRNQTCGIGDVAVDSRGEILKPQPDRLTPNDLAAMQILGVYPPRWEYRQCPLCNGLGWVPRVSRWPNTGRITARPTGSSVNLRTGGYTMDEHAIPICGRIRKWLARMAASNEELAAAVDVYFAHGEDRVPVWLLTAPGKTLLRRGDKRTGATALAVVDNERSAQVTNPDTQRGLLLEAADAAATRLLRQAAELWNSIVPDEDVDTEREYREACGL